MQEMQFEGEDGDLVLRSVGVEQEVTPQRQIHNREQLLGDMAYHVKAKTHYWVVILQHKATDKILDNLDGKLEDGDLPILDADTMIGIPAVVCFVCEKKYEPLLRLRKCTGDPNL